MDLLEDLDVFELVGLPAEPRNLCPLMTHARKRPPPAHRHHKEEALADVGDAKDIEERTARAGVVTAEPVEGQEGG